VRVAIGLRLGITIAPVVLWLMQKALMAFPASKTPSECLAITSSTTSFTEPSPSLVFLLSKNPLVYLDLMAKGLMA
jgi:hypothetical protein